MRLRQSKVLLTTLPANFDPRGSWEVRVQNYHVLFHLSQSSSDSAPFSHHIIHGGSFKFELLKLVSSRELSIQDPKLEVLDTTFVKTGDRIQSQGEAVYRKQKRRRRTKLVFLLKSNPHKDFTPSFGFAAAAASLLLNFFNKSSPVRIETHKSCELIPSFTHVTDTLNFMGYTNIDVVFKVTLSLGPGLTLQSQFSSPI